MHQQPTLYLHLKAQPQIQRASLARELFEVLLGSTTGTLVNTISGPAVVLDAFPDILIHVKYPGYASDLTPLIGNKVSGKIHFDYSFSKAEENNEEPAGGASNKDWSTFRLPDVTREEIKVNKNFHWTRRDGSKTIPLSHAFDPLNLQPYFVIE